MFARVTSAQLSPGQIETFISMIRDQVIPRAQNLPGFKGGYWLVDRSTGKGIGVTLFESEEALDATEAQANRIREEVSRGAGLPTPSFQRYEVVASVGSEGTLAA
jgi:heme-degrading monooxygenase HmoA